MFQKSSLPTLLHFVRARAAHQPHVLGKQFLCKSLLTEHEGRKTKATTFCDTKLILLQNSYVSLNHCQTSNLHLIVHVQFFYVDHALANHLEYLQ